MVRFYCEVEMHMIIGSEESGIRCSLVCDILRTMLQIITWLIFVINYSQSGLWSNYDTSCGPVKDLEVEVYKNQARSIKVLIFKYLFPAI